MSVGTPFTARLFVCAFFVWKALGRLTFTFLPRAAFIFYSLCRITMSCTVSPMIRKSPFDNSLICEILRLGWNCLNSPINFLQFRNYSLTPLRMTGIVFLWFGLGRTGVPRGGWEEPGLGWLGNVGEPLALRFLLSRVTSVNPSSWVDDMMI